MLVVTHQAPAQAPDGDAATQSMSLQEASFEQRRAAAHMRELEERMYRLAGVIRDGEPDHAARLMLGLEQARRELIVQRMQTVRELIEARSLDQARTEQDELVARLAELREFLLSHDIELELMLDRLRRLEASLERLEALAAEQDRLIEATPEELAALEALRALMEDQARNARGADGLRVDVEQLEGADGQAGEALAEASQAMADAAAALGRGRLGDAGQPQQQAADQLQQARDALEAMKQDQLDAMRDVVLQEVKRALGEALDAQRDLLEAATVLERKLSEGDRLALDAARRLAPGQAQVGSAIAKVRELVETTDFGVTLPLALRKVEDDATLAAEWLDAAELGAPLLAVQTVIIRSLEALLDAMDDEQDALDRANPDAGPGQPPPDQAGAERAKLIAELKILRMLQQSVLDDTRLIDARRPRRAADLGARLSGAILNLSDRQLKLRDAADRLHQRETEPIPPSQQGDAP